MNNIARDAVASMTIEAQPERVWEALTTPEQIKEYFLGTDAESTWEVGSPITFKGEWQGRHYEDHGEILASEPPALLRISHYSPLSGKPDLAAYPAGRSDVIIRAMSWNSCVPAYSLAFSR